MIDEGPSQEDIERFGDDTARCPACGAEVWHDAGVCPECLEPMVDGPSARTGAAWWRQRRFIAVIVVIMILLLLLWAI